MLGADWFKRKPWAVGMCMCMSTCVDQSLQKEAKHTASCTWFAISATGGVFLEAALRNCTLSCPNILRSNSPFLQFPRRIFLEEDQDLRTTLGFRFRVLVSSLNIAYLEQGRFSPEGLALHLLYNKENIREGGNKQKSSGTSVLRKAIC